MASSVSRRARFPCGAPGCDKAFQSDAALAEHVALCRFVIRELVVPMSPARAAAEAAVRASKSAIVKLGQAALKKKALAAQAASSVPAGQALGPGLLHHLSVGAAPPLAVAPPVHVAVAPAVGALPAVAPAVHVAAAPAVGALPAVASAGPGPAAAAGAVDFALSWLEQSARDSLAAGGPDAPCSSRDLSMLRVLLSASAALVPDVVRFHLVLPLAADGDALPLSSDTWPQVRVWCALVGASWAARSAAAGPATSPVRVPPPGTPVVVDDDSVSGGDSDGGEVHDILVGPPLGDEWGQVVYRPPRKPGNASCVFGWPVGGPGLTADHAAVRGFRVHFTPDRYMLTRLHEPVLLARLGMVLDERLLLDSQFPRLVRSRLTADASFFSARNPAVLKRVVDALASFTLPALSDFVDPGQEVMVLTLEDALRNYVRFLELVFGASADADLVNDLRVLRDESVFRHWLELVVSPVTVLRAFDQALTAWCARAHSTLLRAYVCLPASDTRVRGYVEASRLALPSFLDYFGLQPAPGLYAFVVPHGGVSRPAHGVAAAGAPAAPGVGSPLPAGGGKATAPPVAGGAAVPVTELSGGGGWPAWALQLLARPRDGGTSFTNLAKADPAWRRLYSLRMEGEPICFRFLLGQQCGGCVRKHAAPPPPAL